MSLAEYTARETLRRGSPSLSLDCPAALHRPLVYLACTVLALVINYAAGKEMASDTLNYHLYSGFSALHDRFSQDYFAAGPQSYNTPYAYVPFYLLATSGLSALQVASILAILHSLIFWMTFELALVVFPAGRARTRAAFAGCAVVLAAANPILVQQIGSGFADITTAELVLGGWLLLAIAVRKPSATRVICAAALLGAATALKPTNAVHAVAAGVIVLAVTGSRWSKVRLAALYTAAGGVAFTIVTGPWSYRLAERFGNPFFPLLNNIFRSPEFTTEPLKHYRFIPSSLVEALWRPFALLNPVPMVHEEMRAPDLRYAVLLVLVCILLAQWGWKHVTRQRDSAGPSASVDSPLDTRILAALGCALAIDWAAWLKESGNGRYFLPTACIAAVLVIGLLWHVCAARSKVRNYAILAIFAAQALQSWIGTDFRWTGVPWDGGRWFEVEVPEKLATEPNLYLSIGVQSNSYLAPYLAPGSGMSNFIGGYPLAPTPANREKLDSLLARFGTHLRFLAYGARLYPDSERRSLGVSEVNAALRQLGLRADPGDCNRITVRGLPPLLEVTIGSLPLAKGPADTSYLVTCAVVRDDTDHSGDVARRRSIDLVLDRLEDACPELFQPRRVPTDVRGRGDFAERLYMNTDLAAWISHGWLKFIDPVPMLGEDVKFIGRASDWEKAAPHLACGRRGGHYFVTVLDRKQGQ
jgi:hypothetical protein